MSIPSRRLDLPAVFSRRPSAWAALFLALVTLALFLPFLNPATHWVLSRAGHDLDGQFVWWRQFGFSELKGGHLALWNPRIFSGEPFFGGFQSALLYPPNWLFMILPLAFALNFSIALHVFLAGWFTFLWIKGRGNRGLSALLAALMFPLGGAYFLHLVPGHLPNLCTMAWIPLVFLAVEGWGREGKARWILVGAFVLALQVFSGHIQYVYYTVALSGCYGLYLWVGAAREKKLRLLSGFALLYLGAGLLSAVQLLAGWGAAYGSSRGRPLSLDFLDIADITPERLWCLLMPDFFGGWKDYWGGGMYPEGALFAGVTGFVLAFFALKVSPRPEKKFFGILAIVLTLVGVGKRTPLFALCCRFLPLFGRFRGVGKLNIFISLCLVVLAAMGMDEILERPETLKSLFRGLSRAALFFLAAAVLFAAAPSLGGARLFGKFLGHAGSMAWSLLRAALTLGILAALARQSLRKSAWRAGFWVLAFAELFFFAWNNRPFFDLRALQAKVAVIQKTYDQDPGDYRVCAEVGNYALGTSGLDIWGNDPLLPLRYALFVARTENQDFDHIIDSKCYDVSPPLGLLRLRYVFLQQGNRLVPHRTGFKEAPRAFLVGRWEALKWGDILDKITQIGFDPTREVLLETDPGLGPPPGKSQGNVVLKDLSTDQIEVTVNTSKPSVLVVTDNDGRGWKALPLEGSDQKVFSILPAYGFLRAVPLQAGRHHFLMEYRPTAFVVGKWISVFSWLAFIVLVALGSFNLKRRLNGKDRG